MSIPHHLSISILTYNQCIPSYHETLLMMDVIDLLLWSLKFNYYQDFVDATWSASNRNQGMPLKEAQTYFRSNNQKHDWKQNIHCFVTKEPCKGKEQKQISPLNIKIHGVFHTLTYEHMRHSAHTPPPSLPLEGWEGEGVLTLLPNFQKGGRLDRTSIFRGRFLRKRGWPFSGALQFLHKKYTKIWNI